MSDLNNCAFIGRVTRDAETSLVGAKGTSLTKWSLVNNTGFGQYERTNFFNCQMWGKQGESIKQFLKKGKQIAVVGQLEDTSWDGNDGQRHQQWTLTVTSVTLLADPLSQTQAQVDAVAKGEDTYPDGATF